MAGLIPSAPIYANGLFSLLFVFVLPGLAFVAFLRIPDFPQRWYVIFLASLIANHLLVTLIAAFHLEPLVTYRVAVCVAVTIPAIAVVLRRWRPDSGLAERSTLYASDLRWLAAALTVLALTYFNLWKHGVPNIFLGSDPLISWNGWATIWAQGNFPVHAYGYPQLIPTLWAVTYIFTGSPEQYFSFYIYVGLIMLPILLNAMVLGRLSWWCPLVAGFAFVWFIAEIRMPWLRATLQEGFPDWVSAIFGSCGVVLFAFSEPNGHFDREKITNALLALCLVSLAAVIKPLQGLLAVALLAGISADAWKNLAPAERNRFLIAAFSVLSLLVLLYAIYVTHVLNKALPVPALEDRLSRALALFNSHFTVPFRIVFVVGLLLCPFVKRLRWFALPLYVGIAAWANAVPYDLRNVLCFLMIGAFVPIYAAARRWFAPRVLSHGRQWQPRDAIVAAVLALAAFGLTSPLAMSDERLHRRFADDQLRVEFGPEINRQVGEVLKRGCKVFTPSGALFYIIALAPYRAQIEIYPHVSPLSATLRNQLNGATGCAAVLRTRDLTHPSVLDFIDSYAQQRGLAKIAEDRGMEILITPQWNAR